MGDTILLRRGTLANLPALQEGEPGWCTDTETLYIGGAEGSVAGAVRVGGFELDALNYSPNTFTQATIEAALTAIGTSNKVTLLLRPGTWIISSDADWSAYTNVTFKIVPGAVISHGTFTVNIPNLVSERNSQVFSGTGLITFSGVVGTIYPQWFGAKVDGVTDDASAINKAFAALELEGGKVVLTGNAAIGSKLTYNGRTTRKFFFVGEGTIPPKLTWIGALDGTMFESIAETWKAAIYIDNIFFNNDNDAIRPAKAIHMAVNGEGSAITRSWFNNVKDAIYWQGVILAKIEGNRFNKVTQDAIVFAFGGTLINQLNANMITHNEFAWYGRYAINLVYASGSDGNVIFENSFEGTVAGTVASIYVAQQRMVIMANRFEDAGASGYRSIILDASTGGAANIKIIGNSFGLGGGSQLYTIDITDNADVIYSIGNSFVNVVTAAIYNAHADPDGIWSIGDWGTPLVGGPQASKVSVIGTFRTGISYGSLGMTKAGGVGNVSGEDNIRINDRAFAALGAAPTTGTWAVGDRVFNKTPVVGQPKSWACTVAGTEGVLNAGATTGGITTATPTLIVNVATGISVGQYLAVAGAIVKQKVLTVVGLVVTLDGNATATVSAAAVSFVNGTWVSEGNL